MRLPKRAKYIAYLIYSQEQKATPKTETFNERLQRYQKEADKQNTERTYHSKDKGAR